MAITDIVPSDYAFIIKTLRGHLGLTQSELARRLGVSHITVNRWANGQAKPSARAWQKIRREHPGFESPDDRAQQQLFETEAQDGAPRIDFATPSNIIRAVAEGERLSYGHLFNPAFAAETSLIDPLPHQRIAVYQHMLNQPRLRFLLADDAGAGKTIMTGLYVREMLARRLIRRVLIVPPAGLVGNWERELRLLFN